MFRLSGFCRAGVHMQRHSWFLKLSIAVAVAPKLYVADPAPGRMLCSVARRNGFLPSAKRAVAQAITQKLGRKTLR